MAVGREARAFLTAGWFTEKCRQKNHFRIFISYFVALIFLPSPPARDPSRRPARFRGREFASENPQCGSKTIIACVYWCSRAERRGSRFVAQALQKEQSP
jgi:hypothetical protein